MLGLAWFSYNKNVLWWFEKVTLDTINIGTILNSVTHYLNSSLHLNSNISAPGLKLKILVWDDHCISLMNPHAKFQPPNSVSFGGDKSDRRTNFFLSPSHYEISKLPPFILLWSLGKDHFLKVHYLFYRILIDKKDSDNDQNDELLCLW